MNVREPMLHEDAAELLPWVINESLPDSEVAAVLEHANACVICRRELDELGRLRDSISQASKSIPSPDMRNINARIDKLVENRARLLTSRFGEAISSPWRIAFAAQSVLLVLLAGILLWPESDNAEFTTLTRTLDIPPGIHVRVVFSPDLSQTELSGFLDQFELSVVDGPSARGVYTLGLVESMPLEDRDRLLLYLQSDGRVLFAQAVVAGVEQ